MVALSQKCAIWLVFIVDDHIYITQMYDSFMLWPLLCVVKSYSLAHANLGGWKFHILYIARILLCISLLWCGWALSFDDISLCSPQPAKDTHLTQHLKAEGVHKFHSFGHTLLHQPYLLPGDHRPLHAAWRMSSRLARHTPPLLFTCTILGVVMNDVAGPW